MVSGDDGVKAEEAVVAPPYVSEMSIAHKEDGWVFRFMSLFGAVRQPSRVARAAIRTASAAAGVVACSAKREGLSAAMRIDSQ